MLSSENRSGKKERRKARPTLSLCMIVRDEERLLPGCLRSIRDHVDEIVIVDTGSTDRTIQIAREFGARVFEHPWEEDFAKHRNQSIAYAAGDWILIMDADEEMVPPGGALLARATQHNRADSIALLVVNPIHSGRDFATFNSVRLFRADAGIRYEGIVHNKEVGCARTAYYPIQILHHGYNLDPLKMKAKFARTSGLLKKQVAADPENPLSHHYLAASYMGMGMGPWDPAFYEMAIQEGTLALRLAARRGDEDPVYLGTHYLVASACFKTGDAAEAERLCRSALRRNPDHLDSCFLLAKIHDRRGNHEEARLYARTYIEIRDEILAHPERFGHLVNNNMSNAWRVEFILGKAHYETGSPDGAGSIFRRLGQGPEVNPLAPRLIGGFYFKKACYREAETYLERAARIEKAKPLLYMLCECYGQNGRTDAQLEALSDLIARYPEEMDNLKRIGMAQLARSNFEVAGFCLEKVAAGGDRSPQVMEGLRLARERG